MSSDGHGARPAASAAPPASRVASPAVPKAVKQGLREVDDRFGAARFLRRNMNKVFPDHWSFMLGEIALYSFVVLLLSGTFLTFFFRPGTQEVVYNGSYAPLRGIPMSEAFDSTLRLSFDVRGGLLMRQIHHWAALLFVGAIVAHMARIFFTGAFRKPRETNWIIGFLLMTMALLEGFAGYSLPDDLLSGTGLRIAYGVTESIPVVGSYIASFAFGGQFPGTDLIPRLYVVHILLIPGLMLALISAHMMIMWHQKHTQWPATHRTNDNVVGAPFYPAFMAKTGGFFFATFAVTTFLAAVAQINPVWIYGPYNPTQVSAGSQPDFYIGWLEGALRMMPNLETHVAGHTISWNVFVPAALLPGLLFTAMAVYPALEAWVTGDRGIHNICDRPRNRPGRTGLGVMMLTYFGILLLAGANDLISAWFHISLYATTWTFRILFLFLPPIMFFVTRRICLGLQRNDLHSAEHGYETGRIVMLPHGEFIEVEAALPDDAVERMGLPYRQGPAPELPPAVDKDGVAYRKGAGAINRVRRALGGLIYEPDVEPHQPGGGHGAHELERGAAEHPDEHEALTGPPSSD